MIHQRFELVLWNEKRKLYNRFVLLLFTLNGVGSVIALLYAGKPLIGMEGLGLLIASIAANVICILISQGKIKSTIHTANFAILVILIFWVAIGYWWIAILVTIMIMLYRISQMELIVLVSSEMIRYPSFPVKKIDWAELNNLVLKDGLLTIDLKNNKIIQQMVDAEKTSVDEKEFNEFCRVNLKSRSDNNSKPDYGGAIEGLGEIVSSL